MEVTQSSFKSLRVANGPFVDWNVGRMKDLVVVNWEVFIDNMNTV